MVLLERKRTPQSKNKTSHSKNITPHSTVSTSDKICSYMVECLSDNTSTVDSFQ